MEQNDKGMEQARNSPWNKRRRRGANNSSAQRNKGLRVVFDTNILVSASFWFGSSAQALDFALEEKFLCFTSKELLDEYSRIVLRDFDISTDNFTMRMKDLLLVAHIVEPKQKLNVVLDPDDNKVIEAAVEANADVIVSGDKHLLNLKKYGGIRVLSAKEFVELICGV